MITVALSITHASFDPRRRESMARLRKQLKLGDIQLEDPDVPANDGCATVPCFGRIKYHEETGKAPHHVWSQRQWLWGSRTDADWVIFLQDDAIVSPDFWPQLEKFLQSTMLSEAPACWLNLLTNHPGSRLAFMRGFIAYETVDGLNGVGYAASTAELRRMLEWRELEIVPGTAERLSEDVLLSLFCLALYRTILTPLPGLIDHDLSVGTLHSEEHMANRKAYVRWDDEDRRSKSEQPDGYIALGRFYETAHQMLPSVLLDSMQGVELARQYEQDPCPPEYNRLFEMIAAQKDSR